ncbi:hypothetical protein [Williamwhitmania taraxaci]|uniref:hypothetical protein n=1 Tax=Williamwhitmania taraxaci TaxID=1640674 RepID=UPI000F7ADCFB|nr:hypothetical protein [Williamwhitmania taraxaci]
MNHILVVWARNNTIQFTTITKFLIPGNGEANEQPPYRTKAYKYHKGAFSISFANKSETINELH